MDDSAMLVVLLLVAAAILLILKAFSGGKKGSSGSTIYGTEGGAGKKTTPPADDKSKDKDPKKDEDKNEGKKDTDSGKAGHVPPDDIVSDRGHSRGKGSIDPGSQTFVIFEPGFSESGWRCFYCEAENKTGDVRCQVCGKPRNET